MYTLYGRRALYRRRTVRPPTVLLGTKIKMYTAELPPPLNYGMAQQSKEISTRTNGRMTLSSVLHVGEDFRREMAARSIIRGLAVSRRIALHPTTLSN